MNSHTNKHKEISHCSKELFPFSLGRFEEIFGSRKFFCFFSKLGGIFFSKENRKDPFDFRQNRENLEKIWELQRFCKNMGNSEPCPSLKNFSEKNEIHHLLGKNKSFS